MLYSPALVFFHLFSYTIKGVYKAMPFTVEKDDWSTARVPPTALLLTSWPKSVPTCWWHMACQCGTVCRLMAGRRRLVLTPPFGLVICMLLRCCSAMGRRLNGLALVSVSFILLVWRFSVFWGRSWAVGEWWPRWTPYIFSTNKIKMVRQFPWAEKM